MLQQDGNLVVRVELSGVRLEAVDISVHDRVLIISGKREQACEEEQERLSRQGAQ